MLTEKESKELLRIGEEKRDGKVEESWNVVGAKFGMTGEQARDYVRKRIYKVNNDNIERVLVISDLHIPFHLDNLLDILSEYKGKVDTLIFNGDEEDCQSISKFMKKYRLSFIEELIETRQLIIDIINLIKPKKAIFNYGNHNKRLISYFSDKLHEDLLSLMPETNLELIINDGFYNRDRKNGTKVFYEPLNKVIANCEIEYTGNWFNQIGDTIFCHPSAYRSPILKTVEQAWLYFLQHQHRFNCLICSHTHASGFYRYGNGYIFENGCLCQEMDYSKEGRLLRPQSNGFIYCVLEDGKFNYEKSKLVLL